MTFSLFLTPNDLEGNYSINRPFNLLPGLKPNQFAFRKLLLHNNVERVRNFPVRHMPAVGPLDRIAWQTFHLKHETLLKIQSLPPAQPQKRRLDPLPQAWLVCEQWRLLFCNGRVPGFVKLLARSVLARKPNVLFNRGVEQIYLLDTITISFNKTPGSNRRMYSTHPVISIEKPRN